MDKLEVDTVAQHVNVRSDLECIPQAFILLGGDDKSANSLPARGESLLNPTHVALALSQDSIATPALFQLNDHEVAAVRVFAEEVDYTDF